MKKIMKYHPPMCGAAIAIVLVCSTLATSAHAWSDGKTPQIEVTGHLDKYGQDREAGGGQLATPVQLPTGFAPMGVSAYIYNVPRDNSSLQPPVSCPDAKPIPDTNPATDKPVVIATGEKFKLERDFVAGRTDALSMERTYRSKPSGGRLFGPNWVAGIEYPDLIVGTDSVVVTDQTGAQYVMDKMAPPPGGFTAGIVPYSGPYGTLTRYADGGGLLRPSQGWPPVHL